MRALPQALRVTMGEHQTWRPIGDGWGRLRALLEHEEGCAGGIGGCSCALVGVMVSVRGFAASLIGRSAERRAIRLVAPRVQALFARLAAPTHEWSADLGEWVPMDAIGVQRPQALVPSELLGELAVLLLRGSRSGCADAADRLAMLGFSEAEALGVARRARAGQRPPADAARRSERWHRLHGLASALPEAEQGPAEARLLDALEATCPWGLERQFPLAGRRFDARVSGTGVLVQVDENGHGDYPARDEAMVDAVARGAGFDLVRVAAPRHPPSGQPGAASAPASREYEWRLIREVWARQAAVAAAASIPAPLSPAREEKSL